MAISDTQKVDLLYKKIAWAASKTDTNPPKEAYNEANPSPLLIRGDTLWQLSGSIPASIPSSSSSIVQVYKDAAAGSWAQTIECTELAVTDNRTWSTGLTDWISPEFGSTYFVKVYVDTAGSTTAQTTGTALQAAGVNDDQWYFDYQAGILNFIGTNLPASIASGVVGKSIFISGARYIGPKGVTNWTNGLTIGNLTISGNNISSSSGNVTIAGDLNVVGNTTIAGYSDITIQDSIINMHTQANLAPWTFNDGKDIGFKFHYYDTADKHAALIRANDTGYLEWYARGTEGTSNVFVGSYYGTIKAGELWLANTESSTSTTTGVLRVDGGAGIQGNLWATRIDGTPIGEYNRASVNGTYLYASVGLSTANAVITGASITGANVAGIYITTTNFSTGNAQITGGSITGITGQANTFTVTNFSTSNAFVTSGSITGITGQANTFTVTDFSTGNAQITGGSITGITGQANTFTVTDFSTGNAEITGGSTGTFDYITGNTGISTSNILITGGSVTGITGSANTFVVTDFGTGNAQVTGGNIQGIEYLNATNFSTGNALITGSSITNANISATYLTTINFSSGNVQAGNISANSIQTTSNISAANLTGNIYGNVHADLIYPLLTNVTKFDTTTAIVLPIGDNSQRPLGSQGYFRFNTETHSIEYHNGSAWIPVTNTVTGQSFNGDGSNTTYTLQQVATSIGTLVTINGTLQQPGVAYTINQDQITFAEIPLTTDTIEIRFLGAAVSVTTSVFDDIFVSGNIEMGGNLIPTSNATYTLGNVTNQWKDLWINNVSANNLNVTNEYQVNGKQAVNGPAFSAYASAVLQTITSGSQQKVLFQVEEFDTNNNYANSRFTPTVEGYYQLNAEVRLDGASGTGEMMIVIWKNGAEYKRGTNQQGTQIATNFWAMQVSSVVYANGTSDYFEIYVQQGSGGNVTVTAVNVPYITWFNGCMMRGA